jgi:NSS family neurotransmitter:Na+ symporter
MVERKQWSTNLLFVITAIGTEAGIANFWKFTYLAGQNGGGTFVMLYFIALVVLAIPALAAEILLGRHGGRSVIGSMRLFVERDGISPFWKSFGVIALTCTFLILSFYFVICGWMLRYFVLAAGGAFEHVTAGGAAALNGRFLADPGQMLIYSGVFIVATAIVVANGVNAGIERVSGLLTPLRFVILAGLCIYAATVGDLEGATGFLLTFRWDSLDSQVVLLALGQAFFSLGIGCGVLMTVGAYMKAEYSIARSVITVAFAQGLVAVLAGFSIFPLVFAYGLEASQGPALVFVTLPVAFGQMPHGQLFGSLMFLLLAFAGLTATIVILEALVAYLEEATRFSRKAVTYAAGAAIWIAGIPTVLSFGPWKSVFPLSWFGIASDKTAFALVDYLASNILLPLGGLMVAVIAGWVLSREAVRRELGIGDGVAFKVWYVAVRYVVPAAIIVIFIASQG